MKRLVILGAQDLAQQIAHLAIETNSYEVVGFLDDFLPKDTRQGGIPVLGKINQVEELYAQGIFDDLLMGIGYQHMAFRAECFNRWHPLIPFGKIVHPSCIVDSSAQLSDGTILFSGCILDQHVFIGKNCLLYNGCILSHNGHVGDHTILSPGVKVAGFSALGKSNHLGIGTLVSNHVTTFEHVRTGAGAVIVKSLQESGLYTGIPAKLRP